MNEGKRMKFQGKASADNRVDIILELHWWIKQLADGKVASGFVRSPEVDSEWSLDKPEDCAMNEIAKESYAPTEREKNIMLHALGLDRSKKAYRNFYASGKGDPSTELENLVKQGLMVKRKNPFYDFGDSLYHVTDRGKMVLGV